MYASDKVQSMVEQLSRLNPFYGCEGLPEPPRPDEKSIPRHIPSLEQVPYIQKQLEILTYNHLPHTFFNLEKHRALQSILMTGKEALTEALPIRCLEATFVSLYLTQENRDVDRIPLSFRSCAEGNYYQHIVLVVHVRQPTSLYGALGLSRKRTLMYKPVEYRSLYDLVMDYKREYDVLGHDLIDIKLGLNVTHDPHSRLLPCWRFVALKLSAFEEGLAADSAVSAEPTPATSGPVARAAHAAAPLSPLASPGAVPGRPSEPIYEGPRPVGATSSNSFVSTTQVQPSPSPSDAADAIAASPITTRAAAREALPPLAQFLAKYSRLLPVITEQYYKGLPLVDSTNRNAKLCFMSLEEADRDAKMENARRMELISKVQSPLSLEARKVATNRQLRSEKGRRHAHGRTGAGAGAGATGGASSGRVGIKRPAAAVATLARGATASLRASARQVAGAGPPTTLSPSAAPVGATEGNETIRPAQDVVSMDGRQLHVELDGVHAPCGTPATGSCRGQADQSPASLPSLPPTPRNDSMRLSPTLSFSTITSSSLSDDDFLMDRSRAEGGS